MEQLRYMNFLDQKNDWMFERLMVAFHSILPDCQLLPQSAKIIENQLGNQIDQIVLRVNAWLLDGHKSDVRTEYDEIEFPATPWEFWKKEYAPKWFLARWPVKTSATKIRVAVHHHFVCPHVDPDNPREDAFKHYSWMAEQSGQKKGG